jgi:hypothetical protein
MRRLGVIVALGALLSWFGGVLTASPALARGPKWELQTKSAMTLPAALCGFEVLVTPSVNREFAKTLKTSDGSMILLLTGSVTISYTNLETGKTITENVSGPSKTTIFPDGSFATVEKGRNELNLPPADAARFGLPTVSVTVGARSASFAPDGSPTSMSLNGHVAVDVCAALS